MKLRIAVISLLALAVPGCGGDDDPAAPVVPADDTTPPAAVADLYVAANTDTTMTVTWTAPGDDGNAGTATRYDLRHGPVAITEDSWAACTALPGAPAPAAAGTEQSLTIRNPGGTSLHVALKTVDEAGNWSALSNIVVGSFPLPGGIRQLTTTGDNRQPCLHDGVVTWVHGDGWNEDIHLANLAAAHPAPVALTDNGGEKDYPSNHGSERVVWQGRTGPGDDWEIFVYRPHSVPTYAAHTDNEVPDMYPVLAGAGDFAWLQGPIMFEKVMYWHESSHGDVLISGACCPVAEFSNEPPAAHDGAVVWRSWHRATSGPFHAYVWNGTLTDLTDVVEANIARRFSIHAGTMAYEYSGNPTQVAYWDGAAARVVAAGSEPSLHDGRIAFTVWDGHDYEIRYWDGTQVIAITDNSINDTQPTLWGGLLAWVGRPSGGQGQIYYIVLD